MESHLIESEILDLIFLGLDLTPEEEQEDEDHQQIDRHDIVQQVIAGCVQLAEVVDVVIAFVDEGH